MEVVKYKGLERSPGQKGQGFPVKNENSRATHKLSVSGPHIPTSNLIILKANLGTLFL